MKRLYRKFIVILLISLGVACRKESPNIMNPEDAEYYTSTESIHSETFENFWNAMNTSYLFWDIDPTDWDAVYDEYEPKFKELDLIYQEEDEDDYILVDNYADGGATKIYSLPSYETAMEYYTEITADLADYHFYFELKGAGALYPATTKINERDYYHDYESDFRLYAWSACKNRPETFTNFKSAVYSNGFYIYSAEIDSIALLALSAFDISDYVYLGSSNTQVGNMSNATIDEVLDNYFDIIDNSESLKGAIFDLRNNTGGYLYDLNILFDRYVNSNDYIGFLRTRQKNGPNRLDYSPYITTSLNGDSDEPTRSFPIVSLVNLYSISMGEVSTMFFKEFNPNSIRIGERTFGGHGQITDDSYLAGGMIETNYMLIYTSSTFVSDMDEVCHEGVGLTPDIEILYNDVIDELHAGNDIIMNTAIDYLNNL